MVGHARVRGGATGEGLPQQNTIAPDITATGILAIIQSLKQTIETCTENGEAAYLEGLINVNTCSSYWTSWQ